MCKIDKESLAYAWESTGVPLEEIAELVLDQQDYINQLKAKIDKLEKRTFEEEFMAK